MTAVRSGSAVAIRPLDGSDLIARRAEIVRVYDEVFGEPPYNESPLAIREFGERLLVHAAAEGLRAVAAFAGDDVVGFAYGVASRPGQWWHDVVRRALEPNLAHQWLGDAFEMVELALCSRFRGKGIGGALHDALIVKLPQRTAIASTFLDDGLAMGLYRRRGWAVLLEGVEFQGVGLPYAIMGLDLRASLPRPPGAEGPG
jgi:GNAT superfamily N-acetyltransferase